MENTSDEPVKSKSGQVGSSREGNAPPQDDNPIFPE